MPAADHGGDAGITATQTGAAHGDNAAYPRPFLCKAVSFIARARFQIFRAATDQLIEDVWGYDFEGNERTLDVHINRLRERFPADRYAFKITTVRGLGYRLEVLL